MRMKPVFLAALALVPVMASAETVTRWTPERIEAAKEAAAVRKLETDTEIVNGAASDRRVHGEVGVAVGTGGYRSIYGTAVAPLGNDGIFAFSFENTQSDQGRYYRRR